MSPERPGRVSLQRGLTRCHYTEASQGVTTERPDRVSPERPGRVSLQRGLTGCHYTEASQGVTSLLPRYFFSLSLSLSLFFFFFFFWYLSVSSVYCFSISVCLLVACLTFQQHAGVAQGRICSDNCTCCHTEIEDADQTFYHAQSQYTDTVPTSPSDDPLTPVAWQGSHWSANF